MLRSYNLVAFVSGFFLLSSVAFGQEVIEDPRCTQENSISLVSQLVEEGRSVPEAEKRIRILVRSAEFIWKYDEPAARRYFTDAYKVAVDNFKEKGFETRKAGSDPRSLATRIPDHRFEVITAIAKKDSKWAQRLMDEVLNEFEKDAKDRKETDQLREITSTLAIAVEAADRDPSFSLALMRRLLKYPLDYQWFHSLFTLSSKNRSLADSFYLELLSHYSRSTPRRLLFLSAYPFAKGRILGPDKFGFGVSVPEGMEPRFDLQQAFIQSYVNRVLIYAADPQERMAPPDTTYRLPEPVYMFTALEELEPIVIENFPFLLQRFAEAKAAANSLLTDEMRNRLSGREGTNQPLALSFDERLELLEKADEEGKLTDGMILNLLTWGSKTEEQFIKLEPWLDRIKEEGVRKDSISFFWFQRAQLAIKEERFADSEQHAKKVPEVEHRALLAFELAEAQLKNVNDAASAYQTLNEVAKLVRTTENSAAKAKILLGLANQYSKLNKSFALEELAEAIRVVNRTKDPDMSSTAVYRQIVGKTFAFYVVYMLPGANLENTFEKFGEDHFDNALSNARALDDKYLRTIAVLSVARNCIDKVEKEQTAVMPQ